ncbi:hypothetical protein P5673_003657 [Acropora cervicornis]|uniref:Uncharacterized protein n=1 Tax=Acropora cervicornis TaxID=6130 RepID=A0AAD9VE66_ACRCE|nr:hypothetical protein P5673_003657 [Acropora cervicornis]
MIVVDDNDGFANSYKHGDHEEAAAERGNISEVTDNRHLVGRAGRRSKEN